MSVTLQNVSNRMLVYQLPKCPNAAQAGLKWVSEKAMRTSQGKDGTMRRTKVKLRHPPVLRLAVGETRSGLPIEVLRDPNIKRDSKGRRPLLKVLERPSAPVLAEKAQERVAPSTLPKSSKKRSKKSKDTPDSQEQ